MAEFARDKLTGQQFIRNEQTGEFEPFTDTDSTLEAVLVNAGAQLTRFGRGAQDLLGIGDSAELRQEQREADELLAPLRQARPGAAFAGDVLPGLATAPIGLGLSVGRSLALSGALGAFEGLLNLDPNSVDQTDQVLTGLIGGFLGEGIGRSAGRVANAIRGAGQTLTRSEAGSELAARGMQTLPSERLNVRGQNIEPLQRLEQGAKAGVFTPKIFREIAQERTDLANNAAARSVGLTGPVDDFGVDTLGEASEAISNKFQAIASEAVDGLQGRSIPIGEELADRILKTKGQVKELFARGRFKGLDPDVGGNHLTASELLIARRALSQDAANAAGHGQHELAQDIFEDVGELDTILEGIIGADRLDDFTAARQQYRNLQILSKRGVINDAGEVQPKALKRALQAQTGYGRKFQTGDTAGLLPETEELFDVARTLSRPELQPFRSSGTAENTAVRDLASAAALAAADPVAGGVGLATRLAAPAGLSLLGGTNRAANAFGGLLQAAPGGFGRGGGELGPSILDQLLLQQLQGNEQQ